MKNFYILYFMLLFVGCGYTPNYSLDVTSQSKLPIHDVKIAIAPFSDVRSYKGPYVGRVSERGFSEMIAKHLEHVRLFIFQDVVGKECVSLTSEQLFKLKNKGYHAILIGKIKIHYGFQNEVKPTTFGEAAASVGAVSVAPILAFPLAAVDSSKEVIYGGKTNLSDLKLIGTSSGRILWEGHALGEVQSRGRKGWKGKGMKGAEESLKNAVISLIEQLKSASF